MAELPVMTKLTIFNPTTSG